MQSTIAFLALVASASAASAPIISGGVPSYCTSDFTGTFEISPQNVSTYSAGSQTLPSCTTNPIISLQGGTLKDQDNRQAEVVANDQFQFDNPLQTPRQYDTGFQVCTDPTNSKNVTLAHGGDSIFYSCNSGSFDNIYDRNIDGKCTQIFVVILPCGSSSTPNSSGSGSGSSGSSSVVSSSSSSSSSSTSSTSLVSVTPSSTPSTSATVATTPVASSSTPAVVPAPYPTGNTTAPAASGTGSPSSTAPGSTTSKPLTAPASGANALAIGSTFGAVAAAVIAFAMS